MYKFFFNKLEIILYYILIVNFRLKTQNIFNLNKKIKINLLPLFNLINFIN